MKIISRPFTHNRGFTLIELLLVVGIIGILSSFVLVNTQESRAQARDAERMNDLRQLQTALELYYNRNKDYPDHDPSTRLEQIASELEPYISPVPNDPLSERVGTSRNYRYAKNSTGYAILARSDDDSTWCSVRSSNSTVWASEETYPPCPFY